MSKDLYIYGGDYESGLDTYLNTKIENHSVPIHPYYAKIMNIDFKVGDLVETCTGQIALIKETDIEPRDRSMIIFGANNGYYKVIAEGQEKVYVGYSLKKIKKNT